MVYPTNRIPPAKESTQGSFGYASVGLVFVRGGDFASIGLVFVF